MSDGVVITAWEAVSPFGVGRESFAEGLWAGRDPAVDVNPERWQVPDRRVCLVPDFEHREILGAKGTRSMDRVTGLAVVAVGELIGDRDGAGRTGADEDWGLVLGTTTGSAQSMTDFTRTSLTGKKPFHVDPSLMPNAVMNCAAGQCGIWYRLKGPNATVAGGRAAGLLALSYQRRLAASGRVRKMVCGAVEEYSPARSWLEYHSRYPAVEPVVLGEGCAVLLLEPAAAQRPDDAPLAQLLAVRSRVFDADPAEAVALCARQALADAGASPEEVWAVSPGRPPGTCGDREHEALAGLFDPATFTRVPSPPFGDTGAASAVFQIAALLSTVGRIPAAAGRLTLVSSVDRDGVAACAILRLGSGSVPAQR